MYLFLGLGRCLLCGRRLLLGRRLLGSCSSRLLLGLVSRRELLLELRRELVGVLDLHKISGGNARFERLQKGSVLPLLVLGELGHHELLDGDHARTGAVLEFRDGFDDSVLVRHGDAVCFSAVLSVGNCFVLCFWWKRDEKSSKVGAPGNLAILLLVQLYKILHT